MSDINAEQHQGTQAQAINIPHGQVEQSDRETDTDTESDQQSETDHGQPSENDSQHSLRERSASPGRRPGNGRGRRGPGRRPARGPGRRPARGRRGRGRGGRWYPQELQPSASSSTVTADDNCRPGGSELIHDNLKPDIEPSVPGLELSFTSQGTDISFESQEADDSLYLPSPEKCVVKNLREVTMPKVYCILDLTQLDCLLKDINAARQCRTPGCTGNLIPTYRRSLGLGGSNTLLYACSGCGQHSIQFDTSFNLGAAKYGFGVSTEVSLAVQVAFVVAGCTHATYARVLKYALGMDAVTADTFYSTIKKMYPAVMQMVDGICALAKQEMMDIDPAELGSWKRAVTCADGAWMTRRFHSQNMTFSMRNYNTGALLYYEHLCQRGGDSIVQKELYKGTSKSAEGYACDLVFKRAKEEGMVVEVQWQDADSSSSNAVKEHFPKCSIMICGGHAGRAHRTQLMTYSSTKTFSRAFKSKHCSKFPSIMSEECVCHCTRNHSRGCGCLSAAFIEKARNSFSFILSTSQSAEAFAERMLALPHHARDEHTWEGGACDFHTQRVCTCGTCEKEEEPKCEGKKYRPKNVLTCPLHSLAYEIECNYRASMADRLVHPVMKRGHSNLVESSHNTFIRFRSKDIHLHRLHYETSTNLALLQSNMTYMYRKRGASYHWVPELYKLLKLPVFDGLQEALEDKNRKRKAKLESLKTDKSKRRVIQLKRERLKESELRKKYSKKHGHHSYGDSHQDSTVEDQVANSQTCSKCGSNSHRRPTSKLCPYNKTKGKLSSLSCDNREKEDVDEALPCSDKEEMSSNEDSADCMSDYEGAYDTDIKDVRLCTCKEGVKAHSRDCPANPRKILKFEPDVNDNMQVVSNVVVPPLSAVKRANEASQSDIPSTKKQRCGEAVELKVGDYVYLHSSGFKKLHLPCRIVDIIRQLHRLCFGGAHVQVLDTCFSAVDLTPRRCSHMIVLDGWRLAPRVALSTAKLENLENCECDIVESEVVDLTGDSDSVFTKGTCNVWVKTLLYTLTFPDRDCVLEHNGWLNDNVIKVAQELIGQHFPNMWGLQPPTVVESMGFRLGPRTEFVQIVHVRGNHWCVVSNVGCKEGVVNVYDSLYEFVPVSTQRVIASLVFCTAPKLTIQIMDVEKQINRSDCGVLSIAYAYELCSGGDPSKVRFDHKSIRQHLAKCLEECKLARFPVIGKRADRSRTMVKKIQEVELHCTCRLSDDPTLTWAECTSCCRWFHKHCLDVPDDAFENVSVEWLCKVCANSLSED